jgi:hypothetical protein
MLPQFKIVENKEGKFEVYYVEKITRSWDFKVKVVLKPYITYAGLDYVYPFSSLENAINELKIEIIKNTRLQ